MGNSIVASRGLLAKVVAGMAIALFWCVSAISTVGVASLATAVSAVTSPAWAGDRDRRNRDGNRTETATVANAVAVVAATVGSGTGGRDLGGIKALKWFEFSAAIS